VVESLGAVAFRAKPARGRLARTAERQAANGGGGRGPFRRRARSRPGEGSACYRPWERVRPFLRSGATLLGAERSKTAALATFPGGAHVVILSRRLADPS